MDSGKLKPPLYVNEVLALFNYDASTQAFTWKHSRGKAKAGSPAEVIQGGYATLLVNGHKYRAHQIVWLLTYGVWPSFPIDHINGNRLDNRPNNLRPTNKSLNAQNMKHPRSDSKSGYLGVKSQRNRFCARIAVNGKRYHLGSFGSPQEAYAAYLKAKRYLHRANTL